MFRYADVKRLTFILNHQRRLNVIRRCLLTAGHFSSDKKKKADKKKGMNYENLLA